MNLNIVEDRIERVKGGSVGIVYTISRLLGGGSVLSLAAGTNPNLSLVGTNIVAAAAIPAGTTQEAVVSEETARRSIKYPVAITAAPIAGSGGTTPSPTPPPTPVATPAPGVAFAHAQPGWDVGTRGYSTAGTANDDQIVLRVPDAGAALPAPGKDWFQYFFIRVDEQIPIAGTANLLGDTAGGIISYGFALSANALVPVTASTIMGGASQENPDMRFRPGGCYMVGIGQLGTKAFLATVQLDDEGLRAVGAPVINLGADNNGLNGYYYKSDGGGRWVDGSKTLFQTLGGLNRAIKSPGWAAIGGYGSLWGTFPNNAGVPDAATLQNLARGALDPATLAATMAGGVFRYYNHCTFGDLTADQRAVVKDPITELSVNVPPIRPARAAHPIRIDPSLALDTFGHGFVFGIDASWTATVPFTGVYGGNTAPGYLEGRLVRLDGSVFVDWTDIGAVSANGRFSGSLKNVARGTAFYMQVRWGGTPSLVFAGAEKVTVGVVPGMLSQSQVALMFYGSAAPDAGSGITLTPSSDDNAWLAQLRPNPLGSLNAVFARTAVNTPLLTLESPEYGRVGLGLPWTAGQTGDGIISMYERIKAIANCAVMCADMARPGYHPIGFIYDRSNLSFSIWNGGSDGAAFSGFVPDGVKTDFTTFKVYPKELMISGDAAVAGSPRLMDMSFTPGKFKLEVGGTLITDVSNNDGNRTGTLTGAGVTGTINYVTCALTLSFTTAPPANVSKSGSATYYSDARAAYPTGYTLFGDATATTRRAAQASGFLAGVLARLRGATMSEIVIAWQTSMITRFVADAASGFPGYEGWIDLLRAKLMQAAPKSVTTAMPFGIAAATRESGNDFKASFLGPFRKVHRDYASSRAWGRYIGDYWDMATANGLGPHQDPVSPKGAITMGERMGVGVADSLGFASKVTGPVLSDAYFTDASKTAIKLKFTFGDPSATKITTPATVAAGASPIGATAFGVVIDGLEIGNTATGVTAVISGANEITMTKASGAWTSGVQVGVGATGPGGTDRATALAAMDNVFYDDSSAAKYALSGKPGNLPKSAINFVVRDAA